jgi:hypothetical protein
MGAVSLLGVAPGPPQPISPLRPRPSTVAVGALRSTDAADRLARRHAWDEAPRSVRPGQGEDARPAKDDGGLAVSGPPITGSWSQSRAWLSPPQGPRTGDMSPMQTPELALCLVLQW